MEQLLELESVGWVTEWTESLSLQLALFHVPSSLFASVELTLQLPRHGGVKPTYHIRSTHLYKYSSAFDNFVLLCEVSV